jgi:hypothetical protein
MQQTFNPGLGKALLPSPHCPPADADALRHPLRRVSIRRSEHDARPLDVFGVLARLVSGGRDAATCSLSVALTTTHAL